MASSSTIKSTKRFGPRYGKTVKDKFGAIESSQRKSYTCPHCSRNQVRRVSKGIWQCKKCGAKLTSKAYSVTKPAKIQTRVVEI